MVIRGGFQRIVNAAGKKIRWTISVRLIAQAWDDEARRSRSPSIQHWLQCSLCQRHGGIVKQRARLGITY
jgi:hypothetical protein